MLNFSPSCERNKQPILEILNELVGDNTKQNILEIGSLSGQHAIHFCQHLSNVIWQPTDVEENLPALKQNIEQAQLDNCLTPRKLTLGEDIAQLPNYHSMIYSANTLHIVSWPLVEDFFRKVGDILQSDGVLVVYGPFNYEGEYTSTSNADFDLWLKDRDLNSGIRDFEAVNKLASGQGLILQQDIEMPANNRLLVWSMR